MFKKILSALTVMLFIFGMNVSAQDLKNASLMMSEFAEKDVVTSGVGLTDNELCEDNEKGEVKDNRMLVSDATGSNDVTIAVDLGTVIGTSESFELPLKIENTGSNGLSSLELEINVGGVKTVAEVNAPKSMIGAGKPFDFSVNVNIPSSAASHEYTVRVTKINGAAVTNDIIGKGKMIILSRTAEHKVFYEEITGMWCGYCPQGMVAIEKIKQVYGDKVVIVAAHSGDALNCKDYSAITSKVQNYPAVNLDREQMSISSYFGTDHSNFGIQKDIDKLLKNVSVAEVISKPILDGDVLTANAEVKFLYTGDASDYALAYVLTHDGMQDDAWVQENYLSATDFWSTQDPLFDPWVKAGDKVKGVVFGEVAIAAKGIESGIAGSVPAEVTEDVPVTHSVEFNLNDYNIIQNRDSLNLVVLLFNTKTGAVVNSDIMSVKKGTAGVEEVEGEGLNVVETARYTIDGRRINNPESGINIVEYSDGTVKKVIVK